MALDAEAWQVTGSSAAGADGMGSDADDNSLSHSGPWAIRYFEARRSNELFPMLRPRGADRLWFGTLEVAVKIRTSDRLYLV